MNNPVKLPDHMIYSILRCLHLLGILVPPATSFGLQSCPVQITLSICTWFFFNADYFCLLRIIMRTIDIVKNCTRALRKHRKKAEDRIIRGGENDGLRDPIHTLVSLQIL